MLYYDQKDYNKAVAKYNRAIQLDAKYAIALNNRDLAYYHKKLYARAIADYNKAKAGEDVHKAQDLKYSVQGVAGRSAEGAGEEKIRRERKNRHPACLCAPFPKIR